jgi:hypothetical protein
MWWQRHARATQDTWPVNFQKVGRFEESIVLRVGVQTMLVCVPMGWVVVVVSIAAGSLKGRRWCVRKLKHHHFGAVRAARHDPDSTNAWMYVTWYICTLCAYTNVWTHFFKIKPLYGHLYACTYTHIRTYNFKKNTLSPQVNVCARKFTYRGTGARASNRISRHLQGDGNRYIQPSCMHEWMHAYIYALTHAPFSPKLTFEYLSWIWVCARSTCCAPWILHTQG